MNKDQLDGLVVFKMVADTKSFSRAAEALGISHSAVSQSVKNLEHKLGVPLLTRTTRSISLTEAGAKFLKRTSPAIDEIFSAMTEVDLYTQPTGILRLNLPRLLYSSTLAPIISKFIKKYPEVQVELYFDEGASDIVEKGFDAGIRLSEILAKDMIALKVLGPVRFITVASPKYLEKNGRPKRPKDLINHQCIQFRFGPGRIYNHWEFENKSGEFEVKISGSLTVNDPYIVLHSALRGEGIAYLPEDSVEEEIRSKKLEIVLESFASKSSGYFLYFPKHSQVLPKLRVFIDHLKEELK